MKSEFEHLVSFNSGEVLRFFTSARELLKFAQQNRNLERGFVVYVNPDFAHEDEGEGPALLPEKFQALVEDYPGKYFVVSYENRLDKYYAEGSRFQEVGLSTSRHRYDSDERLREIFLREYAASEGKGNVIFLKVSDRVNENSLTKLNTAKGDEINRPHGSAEVIYEVSNDGTKKVVQSEFIRLDEALFSWKGRPTPVRWLRNLDIQKLSKDEFEMVYQDSYMIGRDKNGYTEEQAKIEIKLTGKGDNILSVVIEIGLSGGKQNVLFDDHDDSIRIVEHSPEGLRVFANQMEIIRQDPNYAFIFERPVNKRKLVELVKSKVSLLQSDWDKPQAVFGANRIETGSISKLLKE